MTSAGDRQERQSFRTKRDRDIELITPLHTYDNPGRYSVAVKVIDIFGNDTTTVVPVTVG
jgi:site-specific DNA-methyltransferase (adenine-specific)/adenine-specific DNA-methyltransferase